MASNETFAFLLLSSKWGVQVYTTASSFDDTRGKQTSLMWTVIDNDPHLQMHLQDPFYLCSIQGTWSEMYRNPKYIVIKMGTLPPNHKTSINKDITKGNLDVRCIVFGKLDMCPPLWDHQLPEDISPVHSHHTRRGARCSADSPTSAARARDGLNSQWTPP